MKIFLKHIVHLGYVVCIYPLVGMVIGLAHALILTFNDTLNDSPQFALEAAWSLTSLVSGLVLGPLAVWGLRNRYRLRPSKLQPILDMVSLYDGLLDKVQGWHLWVLKGCILIWPYIFFTGLWAAIALIYYYAMMYWPHPLDMVFMKGYTSTAWLPVVLIGIFPTVINFKDLIYYSRHFGKYRKIFELKPKKEIIIPDSLLEKK